MDLSDALVAELTKLTDTYGWVAKLGRLCTAMHSRWRVTARSAAFNQLRRSTERRNLWLQSKERGRVTGAGAVAISTDPTSWRVLRHIDLGRIAGKLLHS